jgi:hypothetical protein
VNEFLGLDLAFTSIILVILFILLILILIIFYIKLQV